MQRWGPLEGKGKLLDWTYLRKVSDCKIDGLDIHFGKALGCKMNRFFSLAYKVLHGKGRFGVLGG